MTESDYASAADVYNELGVLIDALGGMVRDGRLSVDRDTDRDLADTVRAALDHLYEAREACSHLETHQPPASQAMLPDRIAPCTGRRPPSWTGASAAGEMSRSGSSIQREVRCSR